MRALPYFVAVLLVLAGCDRATEAPSKAKDAPQADEPPADPMAKPPTKTEPKPEPEAPTCLARYSFGDKSVLDEQRRRGGAARWDDFAERYPAAYLDPDSDLPVEVVQSFEIGATPLLWFRPDFSEAVVNAAVSTELKVVNVTTLGVGKREEVGSLTELGQGKIDGRTLAHFLLSADALLSYVHIGSTVCLVSESTDDQGVYRARFSGEHTYFTNEENVDAFGFEFEFGVNGVFAVTGIATQ